MPSPIPAGRGPTLGVLHEHPDWFRPLFQELDRRGTPWARLDARRHTFDPASDEPPVDVLLNRMSPSAWLRGGGATIAYTTHLLAHLERVGVRVVNGSSAWRTETSKAWQISLLASLGLPHPRSRAIHDPAQAPAAAREIGFPVVVKPNVGGSGAGIVRFDGPEELESTVHEGRLDLGLDGTGLVQELLVPEEGRIVRVEVLDGSFLYAIRVYAPEGSYNLCPADVCRSVDGAELLRAACPADAPKNALRVEAYRPPDEVVAAVERLTAAAGIEIGGVEYLVDQRDGGLRYYDVNALSNFVADGPRVLGFDPFSRLADWLERELERVGGGPERVAGGVVAGVAP